MIADIINKPTESSNSSNMLLKILKIIIVSKNPMYLLFLFESPTASLLYFIYVNDNQMKNGKYNTAKIMYSSKMSPPMFCISKARESIHFMCVHLKNKLPQKTVILLLTAQYVN